MENGIAAAAFALQAWVSTLMAWTLSSAFFSALAIIKLAVSCAWAIAADSAFSHASFSPRCHFWKDSCSPFTYSDAMLTASLMI